MERTVGETKNGFACGTGAGAVRVSGRVPALYGKADVAERNVGELGKGFTIENPGIF